MKLLIKNANFADGRGIRDILCKDGMITRVAKNIAGKSDEIIDARGLTVFPGFVDMHCHLRDPGYEYKENIYSGTRAAALGGFTSIACMANTRPVNDNKTVTVYINETARRDGVVKVYPIGAATKGLAGEELSEMEELRGAGAVAVSDDGKPVQSAALMRRVLEYAGMLGLPVISHCEEMSLADEGQMNEGYKSTEMGLRGIPSPAESIMVSRDIILAEYLGLSVHIAHVSCRSSIGIIRDAKKRGVKVTCETCPHYFSLTDAACDGFDTNAKVNPPLRCEDDLKAVIEGLADGTIDAIATDHAPHHIDEKNVEFGLALNGFSGFETAYALVNTYLIKKGYISEAQICEKMSAAPARILGLASGGINPGCAADITIVDPDEKWAVCAENFTSKGKNTPFDGMDLTGRVKYTIINGNTVVNNGALI